MKKSSSKTKHHFSIWVHIYQNTRRLLFSRTGRKLTQKQCSERIVKAKTGNLRSRVICVNTFRHFFNLLVSHFPFSLMLSMLACRLRKDRSYSLFDFPLICRRFPHAIPAEPKINPTRIEKTKKTPLWLEKNGRIYIFTYHNSHFYVFTSRQLPPDESQVSFLSCSQPAS